MAEEQGKALAPKMLRYKKEREVERDELKQNPNALPGNSYSTTEGAKTLLPKGSENLKAAQTAGTTFTAATLSDTLAFPPDTMGAVGPTQFFTAVNGRVRTFNKATRAMDGVINADTDVFFSSVMSPIGVNGVTQNFTSDPHIFYDRTTRRWFIDIIDVPNDGQHTNRIMIAVSDAASNGVVSGSTVWSFFFIPIASNFADYPTLGVDTKGLYIGANMFTADSNNDFVNTNAYVVRKSSLLSGGPIVFTEFPNLIGSDGPFTPQGVSNLDSTSNEGYFIGVSAGFFGELILRRVTNVDTSPLLSGNIVVSVGDTRGPRTVPHLGNSLGAGGELDALDDRLYAAMMRNGSLWTAHNIGVDSSGVVSDAPSRDAARWYEIGNLSTTPIVIQFGTVFDNAATNPLSFWIPTVTVTGQGHAVLGCSSSGANARANSAFTGRLVSDAGGTMAAPITYTASTTAYNPPSDTGGAGGRRWGDYSYSSLDPNDNMTVYTIQEFCSGTNTYGVNVGRILAPPPATPVACVPPTLAAGTVTSVTVTATSSNGAAFFDPGAGFANHVTATISGGVNVTSVFVVNATTVELRVNTTGASSGAKTITITNPDGQSRAGAALLAITGGPAVSDIRLSETSHDFGARQINSAADHQVTIFNDGDAALLVSGLSGLPADGFSLLSPPATPFPVAAHSSQNLTVRFQPTTVGAHGATLTISSNDSDTPNAQIALQGSGIDCFVTSAATSPVSPLDLVGTFTAPATAKSNVTKGAKISGKFQIAQQVPGSGVPTPGVPSTTVTVYLLDSNSVPCTLPSPIATLVTKPGKPGKPGLPAKTVKPKISVTLPGTLSVTGKFLLVVVDAQNQILERDKMNNSAISGPLP
jgi:hypothetical protein